MDQELRDDRPPNYRAEANFFSAVTIWWTHKIFSEGKKRDLYESDLPDPLNEHKASYLGDKISRLWSKEYHYAKSRQRTPNLSKVLWKCFAREYFAYGMVLAFIELIVKPAQPLFIALLVRYFTIENSENTNSGTSPMYLMRVIYYNDKNQSKIQMYEALLYAILIIICSLISVCVQHPYMLAVMHLGMKVRVACMSLMYRKTLRMSMLALSPTTVGNIVNLMSNDATRFDMVTMFLHYLWISPIQMILFTYILFVHCGISAFIGSTIIFLFIPVQILLAHYNKRLRWKTAHKTDERVRLMNEIISGIQVIKMYAWEFAFTKLVHKARRKEMRILVRTSYIRGIVMSMIMFTARTAIFITLISYVFVFDGKINSELVFLVSGYYIIMRATMTVFFPQGVTQFAETLITIKRTRDYLLNKDASVGNDQILHPVDTPEIVEVPGDSSQYSLLPVEFVPSIRIIEAYARWNKRYVLRDIELIIKNGDLVVLIGQVGSGKSSLLQVILKELPLCEGFISVKGKVSYASEEPWLFAGSVRQNILFGHPFDRDRYKKVCRVCALLKDFHLLPYGDQTIVGERGISLSGGQRARINLARCIYKEADIYILDDPLSAVDTHVGSQIFEECITSFLKNKIRVLVTHQLQYLQRVGQLVFMEKGRILAKGTYQELQSSGLDFAQFLEKEVEPEPEIPITKKSEMKMNIKPKPLQMPEFSVEMLYDTEQLRTSMMESRGTGVVECKLYKQYIRSGGNWFYIGSLLSIFVITQGCASASDYFIGQWTKIEESPEDFGKSYFLTSSNCIWSYTILTELLIVFSIIRSFLFFFICLRASIKLHDEMFESIVFGRMKFFTNNPSGRILNRFSKDMGAVDEDLPYAMIDFFQMFLNLIGVFVILSVTNYYLILPIFVVVLSIFFVRQFYLKTSRSLKRLEGIVRSHVYAHLNASIQGLSTIRSHGAEEILTYEFDRHMDLHSSAWYLFIATARAVSLWTDLLCVILLTISAFGGLFLQQIFNLQIMAGDVGLSITQCLTLTGLIPWGMRQSAEMENHMTSVERIYDFINIDQEPTLKSSSDKRPPPDWPRRGEIVFENMELKYGLKEVPVLRNINIKIFPEEKVLINSV